MTNALAKPCRIWWTRYHIFSYYLTVKSLWVHWGTFSIGQDRWDNIISSRTWACWHLAWCHSKARSMSLDPLMWVPQQHNLQYDNSISNKNWEIFPVNNHWIEKHCVPNVLRMLIPIQFSTYVKFYWCTVVILMLTHKKSAKTLAPK